MTLVAACSAVPRGGEAPTGGWYRFKVGAFEVVALSDGIAEFPLGQLLTNIEPERLQAARIPAELSFNAYLINTGSNMVLIDTGIGAAPELPALGKLLDNLRAAGYKPTEISDVLLTHMHTDHAGGLVLDGAPAFPNAIVRTAKAESDHFLSAETVANAPDDHKPNYRTVQAALAPYVAAGRHHPFAGPDVLLFSGLRALAAPGHTPGHTVYLLESNGETMLFWGDLLHAAEVQFADPDVAILADTDQQAAIAERKRLFAEAAAKGYRVAGAHLAFPGLGRVTARDNSYAWIPDGANSVRAGGAR